MGRRGRTSGAKGRNLRSFIAAVSALGIAGIVAPPASAAIPPPPVIDVPAEGATATESGVQLEGTGSPGAMVRFQRRDEIERRFVEFRHQHPTAGSGELVRATVNAEGRWKTVAGFLNGEHTIQAIACADEACSDPSFPSNRVSFVVSDTTPPPLEVERPEQGRTLTDVSVAFEGQTMGRSFVEIFVWNPDTGAAGARLSFTRAGGDGSWSSSMNRAVGEHHVAIRSTDPAGNESDLVVRRFRVNPRIPLQPTLREPAAPLLDDSVVPLSGIGEDAGIVVVGVTPHVWITDPGATADIEVVEQADPPVVRAFTAPLAPLPIEAGDVSIDPPEPTGTWGVAGWRILAGLPNGTFEMRARVTSGGGLEGPWSPLRTFTIDDDEPPDAPVVLSPTAGSFHDNALIIASGESEPLATITIARGTEEPAGDGNDGNGPGTDVPCVEDPGAGEPVCPADLAGDGNGTPTAETSCVVTGEILGEGVADHRGIWEARAVLENGTHTLAVTATDPAGNTGEAACVTIEVLDNRIPGAPVIDAPSPGAALPNSLVEVSGRVGADTQEGDIIILTGPAALRIPAAPRVADDGTWQALIGAPNGTHTVSVHTRTPAGRTSSAVERTFSVNDAVAPNPPVITEPRTGDQIAAIPVEISGTTEPLATVTVGEILEGGERRLLATAVAETDGTWTLAVNGDLCATHTIDAQAADTAGNVSIPSGAVTFSIAPPEPPVIDTPAEPLTHDSVVRFSGTAQPGHIVRLRTDPIVGDPAALGDPALVAETQADADGRWSALTGLPNGTYPIVATASTPGCAESEPAPWPGIDVEGRATSPSPAGDLLPTDRVLLTVADAVPPLPPAITSPERRTATNPLPDSWVVVRGTTEPLARVEVRIGYGGAGGENFTPTQTCPICGSSTIVAGEDGTWRLGTVNLRPPAGAHRFLIETFATDPAGNRSVSQGSVNHALVQSRVEVWVNDVTAPERPRISGSSGPGNARRVTGTAEASSTVRIWLIREGTFPEFLGPATTVGGGGSWAVTLQQTFEPGTYTLRATADDRAGNRSEPSSAHTFTIS